jgi:hypothetical protein
MRNGDNGFRSKISLNKDKGKQYFKVKLNVKLVYENFARKGNEQGIHLIEQEVNSLSR